MKPTEPAASRREIRAQADALLSRLFQAARTDQGETAVQALLQRPLDELRPLARLVDRLIGEQARRWKAERVRKVLAQEIMRRAFRNDVFLK